MDAWGGSFRGWGSAWGETSIVPYQEPMYLTINSGQAQLEIATGENPLTVSSGAEYLEVQDG